jgi:hypothetical protein
LISQFPRSERSADDSFNTVVFQKKIYDEGGGPDSTDNPVETDPVLDAFLAAAVFVCAVVFKSAFATVRQVASSFLIFFLSASPRAPPAVPSL